jgi:hypothetical protein
MNDSTRRVLGVVALAVVPVLLALGVAATSRADAGVPNPGTPEYHHHQIGN